MAEDKTVVVEAGGDRGSGSGWIIALVLVVALILGIVFFSRMTGSETSKDNAISHAANQVGKAAGQVGDAAQTAADAAQDAARNNNSK